MSYKKYAFLTLSVAGVVTPVSDVSASPTNNLDYIKLASIIPATGDANGIKVHSTDMDKSSAAYCSSLKFSVSKDASGNYVDPTCDRDTNGDGSINSNDEEPTNMELVTCSDTGDGQYYYKCDCFTDVKSLCNSDGYSLTSNSTCTGNGITGSEVCPLTSATGYKYKKYYKCIYNVCSSDYVLNCGNNQTVNSGDVCYEYNSSNQLETKHSCSCSTDFNETSPCNTSGVWSYTGSCTINGVTKYKCVPNSCGSQYYTTCPSGQTATSYTCKEGTVTKYTCVDIVDPDDTVTSCTEISTQSEFANIKNDFSKSYCLANDITFTGTYVPFIIPDGKSLNFDGKGYKIYNLKMNSSDSVALFKGVKSGTVIKNLHLRDVDITSSVNYAGGIATSVSEGAIVENCSVSGGKITADTWVGGIAGAARDGGEIKNSYVEGLTIKATTGLGNAGGIAGSLSRGGKIRDSYVIDTSVSGPDRVGGITGQINDDGKDYPEIHNSFSSATVSGDDYVGCLVGLDYDGTISNSYYDSSKCSKGGVDGGSHTGVTAKSTTQLKASSLLSGLSSSTWETSSSDFFELIDNKRDINCTKISSQADFEKIRSKPYGSYCLTNDITFTSNHIPITPDYTGNKAIFLYGRNYTIKNMSITKSSGNNVGLFESIRKGSEVKNLHFLNVNVSAPNSMYVAPLSGKITRGSKVTNVTVNGGSITGYKYVGGFSGSVYDSGTVVESCSSVGVTVKVTGSFGSLGGFAGIVKESVVKDSYARNTIVCTNRCGGFIGTLADSGTVNNSYSAAAVTGASYKSCFIGQYYHSGQSYSGNYFDDTLCSLGGDKTGIEGKTTSQMKSTTGTPNLSSTFWNKSSGSYPTLK